MISTAHKDPDPEPDEGRSKSSPGPKTSLYSGESDLKLLSFPSPHLSSASAPHQDNPQAPNSIGLQPFQGVRRMSPPPPESGQSAAEIAQSLYRQAQHYCREHNYSKAIFKACAASELASEATQGGARVATLERSISKLLTKLQKKLV